MCIPIEYGTCFLHNGYHRVRDLVHEYRVRHEGRTMNALTAAGGFDVIQQLDSEEEYILRSFEEQEKKFAEVRIDLLNEQAVRGHIYTLKKQRRNQMCSMMTS